MIADSIRITRYAPGQRRLRIKACDVLDREGNVLCQLPITGYTLEQAAVAGDENTAIRFHSFRVTVVDEAPIADQPTEPFEAVKA